MTRCQIWGTIELHRTLFQKCSHSGINGSKHPMLSISMAYDVISCKKNPKKKMLTFLCRFCSQAQKLPKIYKKNLALIVITIFVFIEIILCINYIYHYQCNNYYWSEIVFRGCAEAMYKHDYGCDREMQVLAVIIKLFFEIIRDNFFVICHHWLQIIFYFTFAASHSYWSKRKSKASEFDMYDDDISKLRN